MKKYFEICLQEAELAYKNNEVPVGALFLNNKTGECFSNHNRTKEKNNRLFHAEMILLNDIFQEWLCIDYTLYVTLKPCYMCFNAAAIMGVGKIVYLLESKEWSNDNFQYLNNEDNKINKRLPLLIKFNNAELENSALELLKDFFKIKRL